VPLCRQALGILGLAGEVAADAEPLAGTGEAHRVELGLAIRPDRGALDPAVHVLGECIALLDAIDAHVQHAVGDVRDEVAAPEIRGGESAHESRYTDAALSCRTLVTTSSGSDESSSCA